MQTRANYALIGAFTLAVIASAFLFVFWFSGGRRDSEVYELHIVFPGSVSGLTNGASVLFNGLKVGDVKSLSLMEEDAGRVQAVVSVDARTPVKIDSRAKLVYTGLTGVASIELSGGTVAAAKMFPSADGKVPLLRADPSDLQNILTTMQTLSQKLDGILTKADNVLGEGEGSVKRTISNVEKFSRALSDNSDGLSTFLQSAGAVGESLQPLGPKLAQLADHADAVIEALDAKRVNDIIARVDQLIATNGQPLSDTIANVRMISNDLARSSPQIESIVRQANDLSKKANDLMTAIDAQKVKSIIDNSTDAAAQLKDATAQADSVAHTVDRAKIQEIVDNANEISRKLNAASDKIDGLMASAQSLLGSPNTDGAMQDIGEAAKSIRKLADNLDVRTRDISVGLTHFTTQGLRQYENLAVNAQQTLAQINRLVQSFEKNPNQLIFGGKSSIPEYSGK